MCRQYSAETEKALKGLIRWEDDPILGSRDNAEWLVLHSLLDDPYQLEIVRRAIRFYLDNAPRIPTIDSLPELLSQETH